MANMHVLSLDGSEFTAVFHIAVPATNNAAGVPWQTVILRVGGGGTTTLPDGDGTLGTISAAEKAQILAGSIVEIVRVNHWNAAFPSGAQLDAIFTQVSADFTALMQAKFSQYGRTR
jgi:hypothetical protein